MDGSITVIQICYTSQCAVNMGLIQLRATPHGMYYINYIYPYHFSSHMLVVVESQVASWRLLIESFRCNIIETI